MKKLLTRKQAFWDVFPKTWEVSSLLCTTFCKITKAHLSETLDSQRDSPDVASLLKALHWTLDFEKELNLMAGGGEISLWEAGGEAEEEGVRSFARFGHEVEEEEGEEGGAVQVGKLLRHGVQPRPRVLPRRPPRDGGVSHVGGDDGALLLPLADHHPVLAVLGGEVDAADPVRDAPVGGRLRPRVPL